MVPAAPAAAYADPTGLNASCQTVERKVYKDIRTLITIDLDAASDTDVQVLTAQILTVAKADSLPVLAEAIQKKLNDPEADLRAFLKTGVFQAWKVSLRIAVGQTMTGAGPKVDAAAQKVLDSEGLDPYLVYLNEELYAARALDCAAQPSPSPSVKPSVTPSATTTSSTSPSATASPVATGGEEGDGEGGGLPVTGANVGIVAGVGGALLLLGGAGFLIGRRRRARFEA
ncbi:LPXTG cell wall anchor domain-containing protein [Actinoplanes sp. CA-252034]|uniref:LPXTG cell wall anchor domain-containing protein n=1 Tax=Actinoplanes sp. CA-252034 TaxID=3239906 RepID=UPI003D95B0E0